MRDTENRVWHFHSVCVGDRARTSAENHKNLSYDMYVAVKNENDLANYPWGGIGANL